MIAHIDELVDVQARTEKGQIIPLLIFWKGQNYTVARIEQRLKPEPKLERITVSIITSKKIGLEFDYGSKSWRMMSIQDEI